MLPLAVGRPSLALCSVPSWHTQRQVDPCLDPVSTQTKGANLQGYQQRSLTACMV